VNLQFRCFPFNRVLKNKHQAVRQGVRRFGKRSPPAADEHLQKPHNAGSRRKARFSNILLIPVTDLLTARGYSSHSGEK
jgi:hypothetical protein